MKMCDRCPGAGGCLLNYNGKACQNWRAKNAPDVVYTNADRIRTMSDEELADLMMVELPCDFLLGTACDIYENCKECILDWLRQPAEEKHENKG